MVTCKEENCGLQQNAVYYFKGRFGFTDSHKTAEYANYCTIKLFIIKVTEFSQNLNALYYVLMHTHTS